MYLNYLMWRHRLPSFPVTIPRHFITSWDVDLGDSVGFFSGVLPISSVDTSNIEASISM